SSYCDGVVEAAARIINGTTRSISIPSLETRLESWPDLGSRVQPCMAEAFITGGNSYLLAVTFHEAGPRISISSSLFLIASLMRVETMRSSFLPGLIRSVTTMLRSCSVMLLSAAPFSQTVAITGEFHEL